MKKIRGYNNGITIISLVITIVLMLILASVTVNVVINGGLFDYAGKSKENIEIASEKETLQQASLIAEAQSKTGRVTVEEMQRAINNVITEEITATAIENGDTIAVKFNNSNRYYYIDNKGNVEGPVEIVFDSTPGALDGTGSQADPFVIMSIEDLVYFSKQVNEGKNNYANKYVELGKTLNFKSDLSYINPNTTEYDEYLGGDGTTGLKEQLTNGLGFRPIGETSASCFRGSFNGNNNEIKNLKIERNSNAGFFGTLADNGGITNLGVQGKIYSYGTNNRSGGIVGLANGKVSITSCYTKGEIVSTNHSAGGIIGGSWGATISIYDCQNYANIKGNYNGIGGIIGIVSGSSAKIFNSCNFGKISSPITTHTGGGGIIGAGENVEIKNCYNVGTIYTASTGYSGYSGLGGIFGNFGGDNLIFINLLNFGKIESNSINANKGGILGNVSGNTAIIENKLFVNCYFNNTVVAKGIGRISGVDEGITIGKSETEIKSKVFIDELNKNIEAGCPYEEENAEGETETKTIDTIGWAKWVYNQNSYPTLDLSTKWNGTEWVKE